MMISSIDKKLAKTHLQVLYEVVEYTKSFWVLTILYVDERPDFCSLKM